MDRTLKIGERLVVEYSQGLIMSKHHYISRTELVEAVISTTPVVIVELDSDEILWASESLEQMLGYAVFGELTGYHLEHLVPERYRVEYKRIRAEYIAKPRNILGDDPQTIIVVRCFDGSDLRVHIRIRPRVIEGRKCVVVMILMMPNESEIAKSAMVKEVGLAVDEMKSIGKELE